MFLKIPAYRIIDFGMLAFAEHVLDTSPAISTRSKMRPVMKAVEAIAESKSGVAEMSDEAATAFREACEVAPVPQLMMSQMGASGQRIGEAQPVPTRAFAAFYEAVENMTAERPAHPDTEPTESMPVAAE